MRLLDHYVEASPAENAAGTPDEEFVRFPIEKVMLRPALTLSILPTRML